MLLNSDMNYEVTSADCAEKSISLIANTYFELYIFDYALPDIAGTELCRFIRKNDPKTPVLFFTAMARPIDYVSRIDAGANEYLVKPNDLDKSPETVKHLSHKNKSGNIAALSKKFRQ